MSNCVREITWHLKREALEKMLQNSASDYTALQFKTCINTEGQTRYYMCLVKVDSPSAGDRYGVARPAGAEEEVCPVPPDCNIPPPPSQKVLGNHQEGN